MMYDERVLSGLNIVQLEQQRDELIVKLKTNIENWLSLDKDNDAWADQVLLDVESLKSVRHFIEIQKLNELRNSFKRNRY